MNRQLTLAILTAAVLGGFLAASPAHAQGTNVAVVDISQIFQQHQGFRADLDAIKAEIKAYEDGLKGDRDSIQTKSEQLKLLKPGSPDYRRLEETLAKQSAGLQVQMGLKRKEFLEREAKVYYKAYLEVQGVIREFSERHAIGLVLRYSSQEIDPQQRESVLSGINRAVVYQDRIDVTGDILAMLNGAARRTPVGGNRPQLPRR